MNTKVLLVEDSTSLAILYKEYVKNEPYELFHVETGREAKQFIEWYLPQLVILDLQLPDISGQEILEWVQENQFPTTIIIATAHGSIDVAVNLIQSGAKDFLEKPIKAERLKTSIAVNLENAKLMNLVDDLKSSLDRHFRGSLAPVLSCKPCIKPLMLLLLPPPAYLSVAKVVPVKRCAQKRYTSKAIVKRNRLSRSTVVRYLETC